LGFNGVLTIHLGCTFGFQAEEAAAEAKRTRRGSRRTRQDSTTSDSRDPSDGSLALALPGSRSPGSPLAPGSSPSALLSGQAAHAAAEAEAEAREEVRVAGGDAGWRRLSVQ
jgi:hypothetical protein